MNDLETNYRADRRLETFEDLARTLLHLLCLAGARVAGFHVVPVGHAAARSRLPRHLQPLASAGAVALPLAAVPADAAVGSGQADERRSHLAQPHGAAL